MSPYVIVEYYIPLCMLFPSSGEYDQDVLTIVDRGGGNILYSGMEYSITLYVIFHINFVNMPVCCEEYSVRW